MKETDLEGKKIIRKSEDETKEERECDIEIKRESERIKMRKKSTTLTAISPALFVLGISEMRRRQSTETKGNSDGLEGEPPG